MKAKELARRWFDNADGEETVTNIGVEFFKDFQALMSQRKPKTPKALLSIYNEINDKWFSMTEEIEKLNNKAGTNNFCNPKGFDVIIKGVVPDLWEAINLSKFLQSDNPSRFNSGK